MVLRTIICLVLMSALSATVFAQSDDPAGRSCDGPPYGNGAANGEGPPEGSGPPAHGGPRECRERRGNNNGNGNGGPPDFAGPPELVMMRKPDHAGPPRFVTLLHCGCDADADVMQFVQITVPDRSRGHLNHLVGSIDSCAPEDSDVHLDFVRLMADCQVTGEGDGLIGDAIAQCTDQLAGDACGELAPPPAGN